MGIKVYKKKGKNALSFLNLADNGKISLDRFTAPWYNNLERESG